MLKQIRYVYEPLRLELEQRLVSALSTMSLVNLTLVSRGLTRRHRASADPIGWARAELGCFRLRSNTPCRLGS
jgi:hypothetical protein